MNRILTIGPADPSLLTKYLTSAHFQFRLKTKNLLIKGADDDQNQQLGQEGFPSPSEFVVNAKNFQTLGYLMLIIILVLGIVKFVCEIINFKLGRKIFYQHCAIKNTPSLLEFV